MVKVVKYVGLSQSFGLPTLNHPLPQMVLAFRAKRLARYKLDFLAAAMTEAADVKSSPGLINKFFSN